MSDYLHELPRGHYCYIALPNSTAMLTGVEHVEVTKSRKVTLVYLDGRKQSATCSVPDLIDDINIDGLIAEVQRKCRAAA